MKIPRIANAVGFLADDLIAEAAGGKKKHHWLGWRVAAACVAAVFLAGAVLLSRAAKSGEKRYRDFEIQTESIAPVWPWEYRTIAEKYTSVQLNGISYAGKERTVSQTWIGAPLGGCSAVGYDETDGGKEYNAAFEAYALKEIAQNQFIAVKMGDEYYVFQREEYDPPDTWGELLDEVNLSGVLDLTHFSENGDGPDSSHFALESDDALWELLHGCRNAPFVEDQNWTAADGNYLSFTVTSEPLGVYRVALYVTEDGYLWTNAFGWQYLFCIGEDNAKQIISWAKEHSVKAAYAPYQNSIVGAVTGITEEELLVDDSILCNDPANGRVFRVPLEDLRISRYLDCGMVGVGDTVQVLYEGEIEGTTVSGAVSLEKVTISG